MGRDTRACQNSNRLVIRTRGVDSFAPSTMGNRVLWILSALGEPLPGISCRWLWLKHKLVLYKAYW